jgi:hypothetical protein
MTVVAAIRVARRTHRPLSTIPCSWRWLSALQCDRLIAQYVWPVQTYEYISTDGVGVYLSAPLLSLQIWESTSSLSDRDILERKSPVRKPFTNEGASA